MDEHPVREALLELLRTRGELTSTDAARELGGNTGLYSFHLRKLAEQGLVEDVPGATGRARPWRLAAGDPKPDAELGDLNRRLEDESYQRWRDNRAHAPAVWRADEAFSEVVYLTPDEMAAMGTAIRSVIELFRHREATPSARPADAAPVAVVARLFPMIDPEQIDPGQD